MHLRRVYTAVYVPVVATGRAAERRDFQIGEGEGLSDETSVHSSIKLGTCAGRLTNLNLAGMNKPSSNLTTVYLDTPLVNLAPEPLEYVPSQVRLGQRNRYPQTSTEVGLYTGGSRRNPPPSPPPYITHPRIHPPTSRAQPRRVIQPATGYDKTFGNLATRGEPLSKFWPQGSEMPNPPTHTYTRIGGGSEVTGIPAEAATDQVFFPGK